MSFFSGAFAPGGGLAGMTSPGINPQMIAQILSMQGRGAAPGAAPAMGGGLAGMMGAGGGAPPMMPGQAASAGAPTMPQPPAARPGGMPQPGMPAPQMIQPPAAPAGGGASPLQQIQQLMALNPQLKNLFSGAQPGAFGSNISMPQIMGAWNSLAGMMPST